MARAFAALSLIMIWWVGILATVEGGHQNAPLADSLISLIPQDRELEGWVRDGAPAVCHDEASLSEYIDGAAPYYLERGALAVLFQYYLQPTSGGEAKIEIFRLRDGDSARLLFAEIQRGKPPSQEREVKELGEGRHLDQALQGVYLLEFYEGPFFVRIEGRGEGLSARRAVIQFGLRVCQSIRVESKAQ